MGNNVRQWVAWLLCLLWMGVIFYLSHQPATASDKLSGQIVESVLQAIEDSIPFVQMDWTMLHHLVRKSAHLVAYLLLGVLVLHALRQTKQVQKRSIMYAFLICVCYAISDEVHQLFIRGRSGEIRDVLIDSLGAAIGIGLYVLLNKDKPERQYQRRK